MNFRSASFYAAYPDAQISNVLHHPQVAFVGRSNAGKSSLLNALCDNKKLARTSNSPGRTQAIVMFALDAAHYLIDLPGYGYAKTSKKMRHSWKSLVEKYVYLATRYGQGQGLLALVIVVDSRRLLQETDWQMIKFASYYQLEVCVFLTKIDKLNQQQRQHAFSQTTIALKDLHNVNVMMGSSMLKKQGIGDLRTWLSERISAI